MAVRNPLVAAVHGGDLTEPPPPDLRAALGHAFADPGLLDEALTHRSALPPRAATGGRRAGTGGGGRALPSTGMGSNERLEFVGDRVLGLLIAEWLAERYPREQEGQLGPRLAQLVSQPVLAGIAERIGVPAALSVAPGESRAGVRLRATVLADAMEALIGALYLDGGLDAARRFVRRVWSAALDAQSDPPKDPKTALQEWLLARGMPLPAYRLASRDGPPHDPVFVIEVTGAGATGTGTAGSKQTAERTAAADLLGKLAP